MRNLDYSGIAQRILISLFDSLDLDFCLRYWEIQMGFCNTTKFLINILMLFWCIYKIKNFDLNTSCIKILCDNIYNLI